MNRGDVKHEKLSTPLRSVLDPFIAKGTGLSLNCSLEILGNLDLVGGTLPWADVDKTGSDLADLATRSHTDLTDIGTNTHAQIDTFIAKFPSGLIMMYGGAAAPTGWVLCDGASLLRAGTYADLFAAIGTTFGSVDGTHFNVPDFQGIFPRGAGTHGTLTNANGVAFAGTLGTYQNDKMQGHKHSLNLGSGAPAAIDGINTGSYNSVNTLPAVSAIANINVPQTDGTNGASRTGAETNPANLGISFIIKI